MRLAFAGGDACLLALGVAVAFGVAFGVGLGVGFVVGVGLRRGAGLDVAVALAVGEPVGFTAALLGVNRGVAVGEVREVGEVRWVDEVRWVGDALEEARRDGTRLGIAGIDGTFVGMVTGEEDRWLVMSPPAMPIPSAATPAPSGISTRNNFT